jgi:putative transcriptional regulator
MDMTIFQIESNKVLPHQGSLLISAPFLRDYHFARSVVLVVEHNEEGTMGIVLNKSFSTLMTLNELVPELAFLPPIPLYKGGPISRETIFYLHTLPFLKDALP